MSLRKKRRIIKHAKEDEKNHWRQNTTLNVIQYIGWNGGYVCGCNRMWDSKSSSIIVIIATKHFSRFQIHLYIEQCKVKCKNPKRNKNAPYALARVYESIFVFFLKLVVCWDSYVRFLIQKTNIILMLLESRVYMFRCSEHTSFISRKCFYERSHRTFLNWFCFSFLRLRLDLTPKINFYCGIECWVCE